jgi:hypothetical protein
MVSFRISSVSSILQLSRLYRLYRETREEQDRRQPRFQDSEEGGSKRDSNWTVKEYRKLTKALNNGIIGIDSVGSIYMSEGVVEFYLPSRTCDEIRAMLTCDSEVPAHQEIRKLYLEKRFEAAEKGKEAVENTHGAKMVDLLLRTGVNKERDIQGTVEVGVNLRRVKQVESTESLQNDSEEESTIDVIAESQSPLSVHEAAQIDSNHSLPLPLTLTASVDLEPALTSQSKNLLTKNNSKKRNR